MTNLVRSDGTKRSRAKRRYNLCMPHKGDRSKRRRPRKGFPYRVAGYLDESTKDMVAKAAELAGESISTFVARAVKERAEGILSSGNGHKNQ